MSGSAKPRRAARARVSCIVTAHNYGRFLAEALDSVLAQDYPADRMEVIVVDDGSTDDTPSVLAGYADRVHVLRQPNLGVNAATSAGIAAASGELLTFLDADDVWPRRRLHHLVRGFEGRPSVGLVYGDMTVIDPKGRVLAPSFRAAGGASAVSGRAFGRLLSFNFVSGGAMMVRADLAPHFSPIPAHGGHQDWWIAVQVARVADVHAIPEPVNRYRMHGANANLGADAARQLRLFEKELPFRRWVLQTLEPGLADDVQVAGALGVFDQMVEAVSRGRGRSVEEVVGLGADARDAGLAALGDASAALDAGDVDATMCRLAAAIAHDPTWTEPRALFRELLGVRAQTAQA